MAFNPENAFEFLQKAQQNCRLGHAYLFCLEDSDLQNCNEILFRCHNFIANINNFPQVSEADFSPNTNLTELNLVKLLRPTSKSRQITIEDVHKITDFLRLKATNHMRKFVIILDCDTMNQRAENALLKTLEEPPGDTHFFLLTAKPNELLPTITSRCISVQVHFPHTEHSLGGFLDTLKLQEEKHILLRKINFILEQKCQDASATMAILNLSAITQQILTKIKQSIDEKIDTEQKEFIKKLGKRDDLNLENIKKEYLALAQSEYLNVRNRLLNLLQKFAYETLKDKRDKNKEKNSAEKQLHIADITARFENLHQMLRRNISEKLALDAGFLNIFQL